MLAHGPILRGENGELPDPIPRTPTPKPTVEMLADLTALALAELPVGFLHLSSEHIVSAFRGPTIARRPKYVPTPTPAAPIP